LDQYPERLPVKTMRELLRETNPPPADATTFDELAEETRAIAAGITTVPRDELLRRVDKALAHNRAGDYRKRFANCLYDFRDLLASDEARGDDVSTYTSWRVQAMDWDDGFFAKPSPDQSWQFTPDQLAEMHREWERKLTETATYLATEAAKAIPALKPHWLAQAGAWQFKHTRFDDAARLFEQVIQESPQHPRAEVAYLMLARTKAEAWHFARRAAEKRGDDVKEFRPMMDVAAAAFDAYLAKYPQGRFAPDIPGWRGGLARDAGNVEDAISEFLKQIDMVDHPEIVRRAVRELEGCLDELEPAKLDEEGAPYPVH
jgi:hypothetical protein